MTKKELVEMLEDVPDNAEVGIALQPSCPMMGRISNVCLKVDTDCNPVGAVIAVSDGEGCTTGYWWKETDVMVGYNGYPILDDNDCE